MTSGVLGAVIILAFFIGITAVTYLVGYLIIKVIKKTEKKDSPQQHDENKGETE